MFPAEKKGHFTQHGCKLPSVVARDGSRLKEIGEGPHSQSEAEHEPGGNGGNDFSTWMSSS